MSDYEINFNIVVEDDVFRVFDDVVDKVVSILILLMF